MKPPTKAPNHPAIYRLQEENISLKAENARLKELLQQKSVSDLIADAEISNVELVISTTNKYDAHELLGKAEQFIRAIAPDRSLTQIESVDLSIWVRSNLWDSTHNWRRSPWGEVKQSILSKTNETDF